ncbi:hypothetical protein H4R34_002763, partial [Dimargaris verticillata]
VEAHIANNCADPGTSVTRPAYKKGCGVASCKAKVVVTAECPKCQSSFCLKHRFESDHQCPGPPPRPTTSLPRFGGRALFSRSPLTPQPPAHGRHASVKVGEISATGPIYIDSSSDDDLSAPASAIVLD